VLGLRDDRIEHFRYTSGAEEGANGEHADLEDCIRELDQSST
jgi:hypothetical protein